MMRNPYFRLNPKKNLLTLNLTQTGDIIFQVNIGGEIVIAPLVTKTTSIITCGIFTKSHYILHEI